MHICEQIVKSANYLHAQGLTQKQLSSMHHFSLKGRDISFGQVKNYFGSNKNLQDRNITFGNRIIYVADQHKQGKGGLSQLIKDALAKWPLK